VTAATVVIVNYGHELTIPACLDALGHGRLVPERVIVVDQTPERGLVDELRGRRGVVVIPMSENIGFPAACNFAAGQVTTEFVVFLNPDTVVDAECLHRLVGAADHPGVAAVGAQVLLAGRVATNAGSNPMHFTGLSWAGRLGDAPESGPPRRVFAVSGAALLVRSDVFAEIGGFAAEYFLYYEDTDLCWRLNLAGWQVWFCPDALVEHEYAFAKPDKWFRLERNRWLMILANYEAVTLAVLAPALLVTEAAIWVAAVRGGWAREKRHATAAVVRDRSIIRRRRRAVRSIRRVRDADLWPMLATRIDSPLLAGPLVAAANPLLALYARCAGALLGRPRHRKDAAAPPY
jgi:GT2 family glycosyltransferase